MSGSEGAGGNPRVGIREWAAVLGVPAVPAVLGVPDPGCPENLGKRLPIRFPPPVGDVCRPNRSTPS